MLLRGLSTHDRFAVFCEVSRARSVERLDKKPDKKLEKFVVKREPRFARFVRRLVPTSGPSVMVLDVRSANLPTKRNQLRLRFP